MIGEVTHRNLSAMKIPHGMAIALGRGSDFLNRRFGIRMPLGAEGPSFLKAGRPIRPHRTTEELHITFRPTQESIADMLKWLLAKGHITPKQAGDVGELVRHRRNMEDRAVRCWRSSGYGIADLP